MTHTNFSDVNHITTGFRSFVEAVLEWATEADDVLLVVVMGSQANPQKITDEWSDIDLAVIVQDMAAYDVQGHWIEQLTPYDFIHTDSAEVGAGLTWHIILESHQMIDLSLFSMEDIQGWMGESDAVKSQSQVFFNSDLLILVDKTDLFSRLVGEDGIGSLLKQDHKIPTKEDVEDVIHEFWYHTLRAIKHLNRDDLWRAFMSCNYKVKRPLLRMIEWQTKARHGWDTNTLYEGRQIAQWADDDVTSQFPAIFQGYDRAALANGLLASIDLFEHTTHEVLNTLEQPLEVSRYQAVSQYARQTLSKMR